MEFLRIFSKITLIGQIIIYGVIGLLAILPILGGYNDPITGLIIVALKLASIIIIPAIAILITISALMLVAIGDKSSITYKKVMMIIFLIVGVLFIVLNITQLGETALSGLASGLIYFILFFLPSILYLYMYITKKKEIENEEIKNNVKENENSITQKDDADFERKIKWTGVFCVIIGVISFLFSNVIAATITIIALCLFYALSKERNIAGPIIGICIGVIYVLSFNILSIIIGLFVILDCVAMIKYIQKVTIKKHMEQIEKYDEFNRQELEKTKEKEKQEKQLNENGFKYDEYDD